VQSELTWHIPVVDGLSRERELLVTVSEGRVVLLPPPGEGFSLTLSAISRLGEALRAAAFESATADMRMAT